MARVAHGDWGVNVDVDFGDIAGGLRRLLERTEGLEPVMQEAAEYMVRSVKNRFRTRTGPDGERWPGLAEATIEIKGHDRPLFLSGELLRSIDVEDVSDRGFSVWTEDPKAQFHQAGTSRPSGRFFSKKFGSRAEPQIPVPARPFMGFSEANLKHISRLLRQHLFELQLGDDE